MTEASIISKVWNFERVETTKPQRTIYRTFVML